MGNSEYPKYAVDIPRELEVKLKHAYADRKLNPIVVAGAVRWVLKRMLQGQGIRFTQDYENSMKKALVLTDAQGVEMVKKLLFVNATTQMAAEAGPIPEGIPSEPGEKEPESLVS